MGKNIERLIELSIDMLFLFKCLLNFLGRFETTSFNSIDILYYSQYWS